ncbi:hypothetical protein [Sphingobacterium sp. LRF_L2]|uniref:hypothetical protein n=1 Tax=Sphingobacterium sp. LRF_L2 TaxID=3369421 RepID=UPI003F5D78AD
MLLFDELPQPLAFYDDIEKQSRFHPGHERNLFRLLVENNRLIPFQIRFDVDETIRDVNILRIDGTHVIGLSIEQFKFVPLPEQEYNYYLWGADSPLVDVNGDDIYILCGDQYFLKIETEHGEYFSEVFSPVSDTDTYLILEWTEDHNVDPVYYGTDFGFKFWFFVDTFITKGLPVVVIDSEEDGFGEIVDISRKVNITYDIDLGVVPNYIYEAIAFMAIHREVRIYTPKNLREGSIKNIALEEAQIEGIPFWHLVVNFQQGRYYYNTACGIDIRPQDVEEVIIDQGATGDAYDSFVEQQDIS